MASRRQNDSAAAPSGGYSTDPSAASSKGRARRAAVIWCGLGFITGSLFWNAMGFGPRFSLAVGIPAASPSYTSSIPTSEKLPHRLPVTQFTDWDPAVEANCIALVLDRSVRQIRSDRCLAGGPKLRYAESSGRQDRLQRLD